MHYIKDMADGHRIHDVYYCKTKISTETKTGKPYDSLVLQDKTGTLDTKVWDPNSPGIGEYEAGDFIEVTGDVITFNNALQAKLTRIRRCSEGEYDLDEYMPCSKKNIDDMFAALMKLVDSVEEENLNKMLHSFFDDNDFCSKFKNASAAKTVHHGFIGGLLEHSLSVAETCDFMAGKYPILKRDLLVTAAILHDIGKIRELSAFPVNDYTDEGQLLGHIVMGSQMLAEKAANIEGFPQVLLAELQHCIIAHHGEYEFGSPKKPAIVEAMALNLADNMDAKMETFTEILEANDRDGWIGFNKFLDSNIRKT